MILWSVEFRDFHYVRLLILLIRLLLLLLRPCKTLKNFYYCARLYTECDTQRYTVNTRFVIYGK